MSTPDPPGPPGQPGQQPGQPGEPDEPGRQPVQPGQQPGPPAPPSGPPYGTPSGQSYGSPPAGQPHGSYQAQPGPERFPGPSSEERTWALAAHVGTLVAAWFAMGFLAPLVVLLVKGKESPFVRRHAVESLNFQITLLIYLVISVILVFLLVGIFLLAALGIFALIVIILATVAASNGQDYRYPLTLRLVS